MPSQPQVFKALKVPSNSAPPAPTPSAEPADTSKPSTISKPEDISSPHELTAFVETLLGQLENKFDDMSSQILDRMAQMSARVDSLESSIQDLINGDVSVPQSPAAGTPSGLGRKSTS